MAPSVQGLRLTPVTVAGRINSGAFQKCKAISEVCDAAASITVTPLVPADYDKLLAQLSVEYGGPAFLHESGVAVYSEVAGWIGDDAAFVKWLEKNGVGGVGKAANSSNGTGANWDEVAESEYQKLLCESGLTCAYLELSYEGNSIGRLVFELFPDLAPKTCANFLALCANGYAGTPIHRIKTGGWFQGGDVATGDGDGGATADSAVLPDESFHIPHSEAGLLGMANAGVPHTAASQFYVTFAPAPQLDYKYSAFGKLVEGTKLLRFLELIDTKNDRPSTALVVSACGELLPFMMGAAASSEEDAAAAKLQSLQRARLQRKELAERKAAAAKVQAAKRGQKARKEKKEQEEAATKVQAISRGRKSRKQVKIAA